MEKSWPGLQVTRASSDSRPAADGALGPSLSTIYQPRQRTAHLAMRRSVRRFRHHRLSLTPDAPTGPIAASPRY